MIRTVNIAIKDDHGNYASLGDTLLVQFKHGPKEIYRLSHVDESAEVVTLVNSDGIISAYFDKIEYFENLGSRN